MRKDIVTRGHKMSVSEEKKVVINKIYEWLNREKWDITKNSKPVFRKQIQISLH
jgi:hypothetical protein